MTHKNSRILNFSEIFLRREDMVKTNRFWLKMPYIFDKGISSNLNNICLREWASINKKMKREHGITLARRSTIRQWKKNHIFPIILLRYLREFGIDENEVYCKAKFFSNRDVTSFINPPRTFNTLHNKDLFYLGGLIIGDGSIRPTTLSICDGHSDITELWHSKKFLENAKSKINTVFGISEDKIRIIRYKHENKYTLYVCNRWLTRFFNYFFRMPYGKKSCTDLSPKKIFSSLGTNNIEFKMAFCRGLFDSDGFISKKSRYVSLVLKNHEILEWVKHTFSELNIETSDIKGVKNSSMLSIPLLGFSVFRDKVGFTHPRKRRLQEILIAKEVKLIVFDGVKRRNLYKEYFDLIKIPELRVTNMGDILKDIIKRMNVNITIFAKKLRICRPYLSETINEQKSIQLKRIWPYLIKFFSKEEIYEMLNDNRIEFRCGSRMASRNPIDLPIKYEEGIERIASAVRPCCEFKMRIKKGNENVLSIIKKHFKVKIMKNREGSYIINSKVFTQFFETFFKYRKRWYM